MNPLLVKIGQLAIFLICAQTLVHFRPKESYEKYIKLLISMMLLILLVEPIMNLLGNDGRGDFLERIQVYEEELQGILTSPELENGEIEQILQSMTQKKVKESITYVQQEAYEEMEEGQLPVSGKAEAQEEQVTGGNVERQEEQATGGNVERQEEQPASGSTEVKVEQPVSVKAIQAGEELAAQGEHSDGTGVSVKVEKIEKVEIGVGYGKSAENP